MAGSSRSARRATPTSCRACIPDLVVGPSTEIIAGNGRIVTAGAIDCHVHLICPQIMEEALGGGITTIIAGGTGPAEGSKATTVTPGSWHLARMLESLDSWPMNVALLGKGNTVSAEAMWEQLRGGAAGFKLHEDWGTTPAAIDACLTVADAAGVQVNIHSDTLNEVGFVEDTLGAIKGRSIHAYHTEGAGGGHAPDIITVAAESYVLPSSTNPTRPHTVNTLDEHLDMLMVCHHLNPSVPEDLAFAESRIRPSTIAAEDLLHDIGAISMIGSDAQAMGRIGEVVLRTWQTAHVMKRRRGALDGDGAADNNRARRYVAKYTICPAVAHGLEGGRLRRGGQARRPGAVGAGVLRGPAACGRQGRHDRLGRDGRCQRVHPHAATGTATADVRRRSRGRRGDVGAFRLAAGDRRRIGRPARRQPQAGPVNNVRNVGKADMPLNDATPRIEVEPDTFTVRIDGEVWQEQPATELPMAQTVFPVLMTGLRPCSRWPTPGCRPAGMCTPAASRKRSPSGLVLDLATLRAFLRRRSAPGSRDRLDRRRGARPSLPRGRRPRNRRPHTGSRSPPGVPRAGPRTLRLAGRVWPADDWDALGTTPHLAVAAGVWCGERLRARHTALSVVYTTMTGSATAAQRLLALDPGDVAALTFELSAMCDRPPTARKDSPTCPIHCSMCWPSATASASAPCSPPERSKGTPCHRISQTASLIATPKGAGSSGCRGSRCASASEARRIR